MPKGSILVVDDSLDNLRLLRDTLQGQGYKVRACDTGAMALRGASAAPTDLILLDIKLPDYDGYEVCQQLKADKATANIPIIFLSALTSTFDKIRGLAVGGADYVTKPFQMEELLARIETHLSIQQLQHNLSQKNAQLVQQIEKNERIQEALFFEKELAQVTLKSIGDAVITTNADGYITSLNPIAESLTGWTQTEAQGTHLFEVFKIVNEFTGNPVENPIVQALDQIKIINLAQNTNLITRNGSLFPIDDSAAPIQDRQGNVLGAVIIFRDITATRDLTRQLSWQASHDSLTGLMNRLGFEQKLEEILAIDNEGYQHHVLCYLDLDQFKVVNDTCGHLAGDELLRQVARLLQQQVREADIFARLGGDEFAFLLYQCPLEKAIEIAEMSRDVIENLRFSWDKQVFRISVSIGVVAIAPEMMDKNTLFGIADAACYAAKDRGRNCVQVYQDSDQALLQQRQERGWVSKIYQALEGNHFRLYFQKVTPINADHKPIYYEILLRLLDQNQKIIAPGIFMPAAERYQLMPAVDRWVIHHFFEQYNLYFQQHPRGIIDPWYLYALNISAASVNNEYFFDFLRQELEKTQIPLSNICFEITEATAIAHFDQAIQFINEIKQLGCSFAIDDFGHGMNSFEYIKYFPVDYLKIDGSFVKNLIHSQVDRAIVESFNHIGHVMNLQTIGEFVENGEILDALTAIGVDYAQGYEISKPTPFSFDQTITQT